MSAILPLQSTLTVPPLAARSEVLASLGPLLLVNGDQLSWCIIGHQRREECAMPLGDEHQECKHVAGCEVLVEGKRSSVMPHEYAQIPKASDLASKCPQIQRVCPLTLALAPPHTPIARASAIRKPQQTRLPHPYCVGGNVASSIDQVLRAPASPAFDPDFTINETVVHGHRLDVSEADQVGSVRVGSRNRSPIRH